MADHVSDISGEASTVRVIGAEAVLDAKQLLGDNADQLQAIMIHSAVFTKLQKDNVIQNVDSKVGKSDSPVMVPTYLGYQVVVDDGIPIIQIYKKTSDVALVTGKKNIILMIHLQVHIHWLKNQMYQILVIIMKRITKGTLHIYLQMVL